MTTRRRPLGPPPRGLIGLFGFPFALVFMAILLAATGAPLPHPGLSFWPWVVAGALTQIAATGLMLAAMGERSFVVTIAYIKTEPIQVAIFGFLFLHDTVTWPMAAAIVLATVGVIVTSTKPGGMVGGIKPTLLGLASGGAFALAAIGFRGAILSLGLADYVMAATFTLVVGLAIQSVALSLYLSLLRPAVMFALLRAWKPSLFAGFMGALASQFWFLSPVRAPGGALRLSSTHQRARSHRHDACRRRRSALDPGLLKNSPRAERTQFLSSGRTGSG